MGLSEKCIAPLVLGGIIAAGASLAGNAIGSASQNKTNQTSIDINRENNAFNAQQAQIQRDWQEKMWGMNNSYNSPNAMISRGLNPFIQGPAALAGSKSPASGGAAASAAGMPSFHYFRRLTCKFFYKGFGYTTYYAFLSFTWLSIKAFHSFAAYF